MAIPDGAVDFRNDRRVGGLRDAVARSPSVDRHRRRAWLPRSCRTASRALRHAEGQERGGRQGRARERACLRACGAKVFYTRTDGSEWTLALKDVVERMGALEMAYNVNDCVELRWGASDDSDEAVDVQAACARGTARKNDRVPRVVPRAPPPPARLVTLSSGTAYPRE